MAGPVCQKLYLVIATETVLLALMSDKFDPRLEIGWGEERGAIDAIGQCALVEVCNEGRLGLGQPCLQSAMRRQGTGSAARRKALDQHLISFQNGHHIAKAYLFGWAGQLGPAASTAPGFEVAGRGKCGNHLGEVIARNIELGSEFAGCHDAIGGSGQTHQDAQSVVGE